MCLKQEMEVLLQQIFNNFLDKFVAKANQSETRNLLKVAFLDIKTKLVHL